MKSEDTDQTADPASLGGRRGWRWAALAAAVIAAAVRLAACGGGSPQASGGEGSSSLNTASGQSSSRQSGVLYGSCMRAHGITNFPDPTANGGFDLPLSAKSNQQWQSASQACQHDLSGGGQAAKQESTASLQEELTFAKCVRSHGITDFPDPTSGGGLVVPPGLNLNSAQFEAAQKACQVPGSPEMPISIGSNGS